MPEIIGVQFQRVGKIYYFDSSEANIETGTNVIVETARGIEYARVALATHWVPEEDIVPPLKPYIRIANEDDDAQNQQNLLDAEEAYGICQEKIELCQLDMKLVNVEYTFDRSKIIFNFTADERVDFRDLIKELAAVFHTRIELRQIGVRDEAKIIGGIGICGQPLCCHRFLNDFSPVSIKMAKEQNLSLNPNKISGCCGRLLCCLNYENEHYVESNRLAREQAKAERACCNDSDCPINRLSEDYDIGDERLLHLGADNSDSEHHSTHEYHHKPRKHDDSDNRTDSDSKSSSHRKPRKPSDSDHDTSILIEDYHSDNHDKHSRSSRNRKPRNSSDHSSKSKRSRRNDSHEERHDKNDRSRKPRSKHSDRNRNDRNKNNGKPQA